MTVAQKDDARTSAEQICRQFAILIKYNAGISDPDKIAIGVRPVNNSREPIECPADLAAAQRDRGDARDRRRCATPTA